MLIVIDNYDSFTYNLVQYLGELKCDLKVFRNDAITLNRIVRMKPTAIVISPGPGRPEGAGISVELIENLAGQIPILGVCLGHQAIGYAFGGKITHAKRLMHGKTSKVTHDGKGIFKSIKNPFEATRYHSLVIDRKSLPDCFIIQAVTKDKDREIMAIQHKEYPIYGVQFHPESILTGEGKQILSNFLRMS